VLSASTSVAARLRRSEFRAVKITFAPSARARRAVSSPMPALPADQDDDLPEEFWFALGARSQDCGFHNSSDQ